jgi:hypothetical protein
MFDSRSSSAESARSTAQSAKLEDASLRKRRTATYTRHLLCERRVPPTPVHVPLSAPYICSYTVVGHERIPEPLRGQRSTLVNYVTYPTWAQTELGLILGNTAAFINGYENDVL